MAVLYGVGVGPGDPELLTLKAVRIICECEVIIVPAKDKYSSVAFEILNQAVPDIRDKEIITVDMPMTKDENILLKAHNNAIDTVVSKLEDNNNVAFITLGDPTIYSTYMYIHTAIKSKGYDVQIINGIPSFLAAASTIDESLVLKDESLHIIPATFGVDETLNLSGTKVFMKAGNRLKEIKNKFSDNKKVFFIEKCGMENEQIIEGIENIPDKAGYYSLMIVYD